MRELFLPIILWLWQHQQAGVVATSVLPLLQIVDRSKDVIKSGGEWISSIEVENAASGHPKVAVAAVIGVHHAKWGERPLLVVQSRDKAAPPSSDEMRQYLKACVRPLAFLADTARRFPLTLHGGFGKREAQLSCAAGQDRLLVDSGSVHHAGRSHSFDCYWEDIQKGVAKAAEQHDAGQAMNLALAKCYWF